MNDLIASGDYIFLATSDASSEFQVVNKNNPSSLSLLGFLNLPQEATGITCADNKIFLSLRSNDSVRIIGPE